MDILNKRLKNHGSWLYGEKKPRLDFDAIFNPLSPQYDTMPIRQKMLIIKELKFCKVDYTLFEEYLNNTFNIQKLQETFKASSDPQFSSLDIHFPLNWFRGQDAGYYHNKNTLDATEGGPSYRMVIEGLEVISAQAFKQLTTESDLLMRKRLLYLEHSLTRPSIRISPNKESVMNEMEDRLLEKIDLYPPEKREGFGVVELLAEDIHDELDEDYKLKKMEYVERLFTAIEKMDIPTLEDMRGFFRNGRIAPKGERIAPSKEWLYEKVWDIAIQRELAKMRGAKLVLRPLPKEEE